MTGDGIYRFAPRSNTEIEDEYGGHVLGATVVPVLNREGAFGVEYEDEEGVKHFLFNRFCHSLEMSWRAAMLLGYSLQRLRLEEYEADNTVNALARFMHASGADSQFDDRWYGDFGVEDEASLQAIVDESGRYHMESAEAEAILLMLVPDKRNLHVSFLESLARSGRLEYSRKLVGYLSRLGETDAANWWNKTTSQDDVDTVPLVPASPRMPRRLSLGSLFGSRRG